MSDCYVIYKSDDSGQFPMYRTTEGKIAVMLYRSRDTAQRFIDAKGMSNEWTITQKSQDDTIQWLRDCMTNSGASEITLDPDPDNCTDPNSTPVIPIVALLIQWEGKDG